METIPAYIGYYFILGIMVLPALYFFDIWVSRAKFGTSLRTWQAGTAALRLAIWPFWIVAGFFVCVAISYLNLRYLREIKRAGGVWVLNGYLAGDFLTDIRPCAKLPFKDDLAMWANNGSLAAGCAIEDAGYAPSDAPFYIGLVDGAERIVSRADLYSVEVSNEPLTH